MNGQSGYMPQHSIGSDQKYAMVPTQQYPMAPIQQYVMAPPMQQYAIPPMQQYAVMPNQQSSMLPLQQYTMAPMQHHPMTPPMQQYPLTPPVHQYVSPPPMLQYSFTPPVQQYATPPPQYQPTAQNYFSPILVQGQPFSQSIVLLTMPVSALKTLGIKKPIDIVAHWTICINGMCYELARQNNKKEPYTYKATPESEFRAKRARQGKTVQEATLGNMASPYQHQIIDEVGK